MHKEKIKAAVRKKISSCRQIWHVYVYNNSSKHVFISGHCRICGPKTSFGNKMSDYMDDKYADMQIFTTEQLSMDAYHG